MATTDSNGDNFVPFWLLTKGHETATVSSGIGFITGNRDLKNSESDRLYAQEHFRDEYPALDFTDNEYFIWHRHPTMKGKKVRDCNIEVNSWRDLDRLIKKGDTVAVCPVRIDLEGGGLVAPDGKIYYFALKMYPLRTESTAEFMEKFGDLEFDPEVKYKDTL